MFKGLFSMFVGLKLDLLALFLQSVFHIGI